MASSSTFLQLPFIQPWKPSNEDWRSLCPLSSNMLVCLMLRCSLSLSSGSTLSLLKHALNCLHVNTSALGHHWERECEYCLPRHWDGEIGESGYTVSLFSNSGPTFLTFEKEVKSEEKVTSQRRFSGLTFFSISRLTWPESQTDPLTWPDSPISHWDALWILLVLLCMYVLLDHSHHHCLCCFVNVWEIPIATTKILAYYHIKPKCLLPMLYLLPEKMYLSQPLLGCFASVLWLCTLSYQPNFLPYMYSCLLFERERELMRVTLHTCLPPLMLYLDIDL